MTVTREEGVCGHCGAPIFLLVCEEENLNSGWRHGHEDNVTLPQQSYVHYIYCKFNDPDTSELAGTPVADPEYFQIVL